MTSAPTHTPGPWSIVPYGDGDSLVIHHNDTDRVCFMATHGGSEDTWQRIQANARLIAAAPDLYEALGEILGPLNICSDNPNVRDDMMLPIDMTMGELRKARAALAKARGQS